jgi:cytohesin
MAYSKELFDAIIARNNERVKKAIADGADVNGICEEEGDYKGAPVLLTAILTNPSDGIIINELVKAGADTAYVDEPSTGFTPLHHAVNLDITIATKALLMAGANPNVLDVQGRTPLHYAGMKGSVFMAELLVLAGGDPTIPATVDNQTMATYAAINVDAETGSNLRQLELDYTKNRELFAFFAEIIKGNQTAINAGIEKFGKSVSATKWTPLMVAVIVNHQPLIEKCIELGADVNTQNDDGVTNALILTFLAGSTSCIDTLLTHNTDVNAQDSLGNSNFANAIILLKDEALPVLEKMMAKNPDINKMNSYGETSLFMAVQFSTPEVVKTLIQKGADISLASEGGGNLLHAAARNFNPEVLQVLVDAGLSIDSRMEDGWQPIHITCEADNLGALKKCIELGADKNAKTNDGQTPLDIARQYHFTELTNFLSSQ